MVVTDGMKNLVKSSETIESRWADAVSHLTALLLVITAVMLGSLATGSPSLKGVWPLFETRGGAPYLGLLWMAALASTKRLALWRRLGAMTYALALIGVLFSMVLSTLGNIERASGSMLFQLILQPAETALALGCIAVAGLLRFKVRGLRGLGLVLVILFVPMALALMSLSLLLVNIDLLLLMYPFQYAIAMSTSALILLTALPICLNAYTQFKQASEKNCLLRVRTALKVLFGLPLMFLVVGVVSNGLLVRINIENHRAAQENLVTSHAAALGIEIDQLVDRTRAASNGDFPTFRDATDARIGQSETARFAPSGWAAHASASNDIEFQVESDDASVRLLLEKGRWLMEASKPVAEDVPNGYRKAPSATLAHLFDSADHFGGSNEQTLDKKYSTSLCETHGRNHPCANEADQPVQEGSYFEADSGGLFLTVTAPVGDLGLRLMERTSVTDMIAPAARSLLGVSFLIVILSGAGAWTMVRMVNPLMSRLEESRAHLQQLLEILPVAVATVEEHGRLEAQNLAARSLLGSRGSDSAPEDGSMLKAIMTACPTVDEMRQTGNETVTCRWLDGRGDEHELEVTQAGSFLSNGSLNARVLVLNDVTRRNQAERTLHRSNEQLMAILEGAGEGICTMRLDGRILALNEVAAQMLATKSVPMNGLDGGENEAFDVEHLGGLKTVLYATFGARESSRGEMVLRSN